MKASSIASTLVRGEMDKTVIDPGNGPKPSEQGASVANKGKAKRSRRGKKHKRDGKLRDASVLLHDVAADVPAGSSYVSALEPDAEAFCERAKKYELLAVPSNSFGVPGWFRLGYCVSYETIQNSLPAWRALAEEYLAVK